MFKEVQIPIIGVVENMSYFVCPDSGKAYEIFGKSKTGELLNNYGVELLGKIPIEPKVAEFSDLGIPIVFAKEDLQSAQEFINIAKKVVEKLN